jgi:hypothetical protein
MRVEIGDRVMDVMLIEEAAIDNLTRIIQE